jgi:hypothetical protein
MPVELEAAVVSVGRSSSRCWIVPLLLLAAFGCGLLAGVCGTTAAQRVMRDKALAAPELVMEQQLARMARELDFTSAQITESQAIFRRRHNRVLAQLLETRDFLMTQLQELEQELSQVVRPEQRPGLTAYFARLRRELPPFHAPPPGFMNPIPSAPASTAPPATPLATPASPAAAL